MTETDNCNRTFRQNIASKFILKTTNNKLNKRINSTVKKKQVEVVKFSSFILLRLPKETLEKSKFFKKKNTKLKKNTNFKDKQSYT